MPRHHEKRVLPYSAAQMFALVSDIERYPDFLPWCLGAAITERTKDTVKADLIVGYKALKDQFTSFVTFEEPTSIRVAYGGGALSHLRNEWGFEPLTSTSCEISFYVDFRLKSGLLNVMMEMFFHTAFLKMVDAFEKRAKVLYG